MSIRFPAIVSEWVMLEDWKGGHPSFPPSSNFPCPPCAIGQIEGPFYESLRGTAFDRLC